MLCILHPTLYIGVQCSLEIQVSLMFIYSGNESMSACSSVRSVSVRSAPSCSVPAPAPVPSPPSAPAPPLHKVPSWENRIYEAATSQVLRHKD